MPRNPQGLYTLPLPPVVPGELIEADWANPTLDDIASALTGSLPRNGSAPMVGPLILRSAPPTQPREAISKQYLEQFLAYATGMPVGAVFAFASTANPAGYLLCNGQAVSRTTYTTLFNAIGTTFGSGDGATTFNVPDMRDWFVRGRGDSRQLGSTQTGAIQLHTHVVQDPGHSHGASQVAHTHATVAHSHGVTDPGHSHTVKGGDLTIGPNWVLNPSAVDAGPVSTSASTTGISIQNAAPNTDSQQPAVAVAGNTTGVAIGSTGEGETRPQNIALDYYIKAIDDATQVTALTGITSSNDNMISINSTNPVVPELVVHANVPFGIPQLGADGKISLSQLPTGTQQFLGYWDASTGQLPVGTFLSGDTYIISVAGVLTVYSPVTLTASAQAVSVGDFIQYVTGSATNPTGWYHVIPSVTTTAGQVSFLPAGGISATNVQDALEELDADVVSNTDDTAFLTAIAPTTVKSYGAVGNGIADDAASIVATNAAQGTVVFPKGTYRISSNVTLTKPVEFAAGASLSVDTGVVVTFMSHVNSIRQMLFSGAGSVMFGDGTPVTSRTLVFPEWWGVVPSIVADQAPALNRMCNSFSTYTTGTLGTECVVSFAAGEFLVGATVSWPRACRVLGAYDRASHFVVADTFLTGDVFTTMAEGVSFENIQFSCGLTRTSGAYIRLAHNYCTVMDIQATDGFGLVDVAAVGARVSNIRAFSWSSLTGGYLVRLAGASSVSTIENLVFVNTGAVSTLYAGVLIGAYSKFYINNVFTRGASYGVLVELTSGTCGDGTIENVITQNVGVAGVYVNPQGTAFCNDLNIRGVNVATMSYGVRIQKDTTNPVRWITISEVTCDIASVAGIAIAASSGNVEHTIIQASQLHSGASGANGISAANCVGLTITGCNCISNTGTGTVLAATCSSVIYSNNRNLSNTVAQFTDNSIAPKAVANNL